MARKLYELEEAAEMLGVTPERLNEMRDRREVYALRDGNVWKFKAEDIERLLADRNEEATAESNDPEFAELDANLDSILLSEVELGQSGPSPSSTVIGKSNAPSSPESDIQLAQPGDSDKNASDSDLGFDLGGRSDVRLASGSDVEKPGSGLSAKFDDLDALDLDLPSPAESGISSGISLGSDALRRNSHDEITLEDQSLSLGEEARSHGSDLSGESAVDLTSGEDDELVLGGSGPGSDVTRSASDSGISLIDPTDSGLSLETSDLQLGGSAVESLELGEDDMIVLEEQGDPDAATQLKADDDFLLTPLEESGGEESDSGSQVIALDADSAEFDESAATMLGSGMSGVTSLDDDVDGLDGGMGELGGIGAGPGATPAHAMAAAMAAGPDMTFKGWHIGLMTITLMFLMLSGMMMYDLMRNMWSWGGAYSVNTSLMDTILGFFEK